MNKKTLITAAALVGMALSSSAGIVWSEDFESATVGATNLSSNTILPGTDVYAKNAAGGFLEVVATPAGFTGNTSAQVMELKATANNFEAITAGSNGAIVPLGAAYSETDTFTYSFDFYLPNDIADLAVGQVQHRWRNGTVGDNVVQGSTINVAGVYHVELTGTLGDYSNQSVIDGFASFVRVTEKNTTVGSTIGYMDNIQLEVVPEPATLGLVAVFGGAVLFIRRRFQI